MASDTLNCREWKGAKEQVVRWLGTPEMYDYQDTRPRMLVGVYVALEAIEAATSASTGAGRRHGKPGNATHWSG